MSISLPFLDFYPLFSISSISQNSFWLNLTIYSSYGLLMPYFTYHLTFNFLIFIFYLEMFKGQKKKKKCLRVTRQYSSDRNYTVLEDWIKIPICILSPLSYFLKPKSLILMQKFFMVTTTVLNNYESWFLFIFRTLKINHDKERFHTYITKSIFN